MSVRFITWIFLTTLIYNQVPISKQAILIESISSTEVMVEATGIYYGNGKRDRHKKKDVKKQGLLRAIEDSKKSAIYFLLFGSTDPLLKNKDEIDKFKILETSFYNLDNISDFITYEDSKLMKKVTIENGKGIKVVKRYKINKEELKKNLQNKNVLELSSDLTLKLGNPVILVIPSVKKGESPIKVLLKNQIYKHAASVIESFLTSREYDVIVPEQIEALESLNTAQLDLSDREDDYAYQLALSIGSDIYIEFSGIEEKAGYGTKKYAATVRAYESTTARILGTETGYSKARKGELMLCVEEAINDALDKVLSRVNNYWKKDIKDGVQYKLVFNMSSEFDDDENEEIQYALMDAIDDIAKKSKENILTMKTMDYSIWCDPLKYNKSSQVYRFLKKHFKDRDTNGVLRKINVNRKMILLKVDYE